MRPLARLQNPESQAVYASYMVRLVCFYLRVLADEEQRIVRFREQQNEAAYAESQSASGSEGDSEEDDDGKGSEATSDSPRPRRTTRNKTQLDIVKDARELFTWTDKQKLCGIKLWDALDSDDKAAQTEALLALISLFVFTTYHPVALSTSLIQFLAVLRYNTDTDRLQTAKNYLYILAGIVYCVRVVAVKTLLPSSQRSTQTEQDCDCFIKMRQKYLADGSFSPISEIISMLAYGKHVGLNAGNSGNAHWSLDKETFYLNSQLIAISLT